MKPVGWEDGRVMAGERLVSIVYGSAATAGFSTLDLDELLSTARANNRVSGVTGMLLYEDGRFLQVLEGPETVVRDLMATIAPDVRHDRVEVLTDEPIEERRFPDWTMGHVHLDDIADQPLTVYADALAAARHEDPDPPTRLDRLRAWFRAA